MVVGVRVAVAEAVGRTVAVSDRTTVLGAAVAVEWRVKGCGGWGVGVNRTVGVFHGWLACRLGVKPPEIKIVATMANKAIIRISAIYRTGCALKLST